MLFRSSFVDSDQFCFKACDNSITSPDYCLNIYDTQGCDFNMAALYKPSEFSVVKVITRTCPVTPATSSLSHHVTYGLRLYITRMTS